MLIFHHFCLSGFFTICAWIDFSPFLCCFSATVGVMLLMTSTFLLHFTFTLSVLRPLCVCVCVCVWERAVWSMARWVLFVCCVYNCVCVCADWCFVCGHERQRAVWLRLVLFSLCSVCVSVLWFVWMLASCVCNWLYVCARERESCMVRWVVFVCVWVLYGLCECWLVCINNCVCTDWCVCVCGHERLRESFMVEMSAV